MMNFKSHIIALALVGSIAGCATPHVSSPEEYARYYVKCHAPIPLYSCPNLNDLPADQQVLALQLSVVEEQQNTERSLYLLTNGAAMMSQPQVQRPVSTYCSQFDNPMGSNMTCRTY